MPCSPSLNSINPPSFPPLPTPGGISFAPIQLGGFPNISLPTDLLEDLLDLVNSLGLLFPSSTFKPNIDEFTKSILDAISNLLSQVAPFLSFYNFIMALLKLIVCIIEVLCAIPNPFKIAKAMVKLFKECLPPFMLLFPFLALIAMIIALLLLILALIEYIIATIIALIEDLIKNLTILGQGVTLQDPEATLAAIQKISNLLCIIQNILAIFVALGAIMAIIEALAKISGGTICDGDDPNGCCSPDVCPSFIKDGPITGLFGQLTYHNQVGLDLASALGISAEIAALLKIAPTRSELWQFVDTSLIASHHFKEIITPIIDFSESPPVIATFWPEGLVFDATTAPNKFPYTVDMRILMNPIQFVTTDIKGSRYMRITNCGVVHRPYLGVLNFVNLLDPNSNQNGTLNLEGGLVFEDDGYTAYMINGMQATLNTFIHKAPITQNVPQTIEDGIFFNNIEFIFNPVYGTLMSYSLITAGCMPNLAIEKGIFNNILIAEDVRAVVDKLGPRTAGEVVPSIGMLPNVAGTQNCVIDALTEFRKNVSITNAALFQASAVTCLNDLRNQTQSLICEAIIAAVSQFKSTMSLDADVQFTSRPIVVSVSLKDAGGTNIGLNIPANCVPEVENKLNGEVTFGKISSFKYDGHALFNADVTSDISGTGTVSVLFDNKIFNTVVQGVGATVTAINHNTLPYSFVNVGHEAAVRRDQTDVSEAKE